MPTGALRITDAQSPTPYGITDAHRPTPYGITNGQSPASCGSTDAPKGQHHMVSPMVGALPTLSLVAMTKARCRVLLQRRHLLLRGGGLASSVRLTRRGGRGCRTTLLVGHTD